MTPNQLGWGLFNDGNGADYHVFNRNKYLGNLMDVPYEKIVGSFDYNTLFIYHREAKKGQSQWWRADGTPYPKEQVPKAYLGMCLLVT